MILCGACKQYRAGESMPPAVRMGGLYPILQVGEGVETIQRRAAWGWCASWNAPMAAHAAACGLYRHRLPEKTRKGAEKFGANGDARQAEYHSAV